MHIFSVKFLTKHCFCDLFILIHIELIQALIYSHIVAVCWLNVCLLLSPLPGDTA